MVKWDEELLNAEFNAIEAGEALEKVKGEMEGEPTEMLTDVLDNMPEGQHAKYQTTFLELEEQLQEMNYSLELYKYPDVKPAMARLKAMLSIKPYLATYLLSKILKERITIKTPQMFIGKVRSYAMTMDLYREGSLHSRLDEFKEMQSQILEEIELHKDEILRAAESTRASVKRQLPGWKKHTPAIKAILEIRRFLPVLDKLIVHIVENPDAVGLTQVGYDAVKFSQVKKILEILRGRNRH